MIKFAVKTLYLAVFCGLLLTACSTGEPPVPARSFTTRDLLIDISVLPSGWLSNDGDHTPDYQGAKDAVYRSFVLPQSECQLCVTWEEVHRFERLTAAKLAFRDMSTSFPGSRPSGWAYQSAVADETSIACYDREGRDIRCEWIARYHEFVIALYAPVIDGRMSLTDMERVVRTIDEQVVGYFAAQKH